ncbi:class I SAM-dependent methyltransferase [Algiphilus sp.]|uniref:SAM-dependent methyltransferase n=1 Tax=Algiphilus sp. TaxID=1872431 RepID=UPI0032EE1789
MTVASTPGLEQEIAYAMEAPVCLLPHLPYLLQDLPSLSGAEDEVVSVLREVGLHPGATVLDLGCGRGEIALRIAQELEATVTGIDGHADFIAQAQQSARNAQCEAQCRFVTGDLRTALRVSEQYDAVMMIALGPILGDTVATIGMLRNVVRAGGWMLIDDAYIQNDAPPPPHYEGYLPRDAMERALTHFGDRIVGRRVHNPAGDAFNAQVLSHVPQRARELAAMHPMLKPELDQYVHRQHAEVALMQEAVVPVLWALQKTPTLPPGT